MPSDACPLCGMSVSLLRTKDRRTEAEVLRKRITTLRERSAALEHGRLSPRQLKDDVLWLCTGCQRIMTGLGPLDTDALRQRVAERADALERILTNLTRRAG